MRTTNRSSAFRRDFKRVQASPRHRDLPSLLSELVDLLAADRPFPQRHRDHALVGHWSGYRECHVKPDLLLVYEKIGTDRLDLVRLGSHSELFGK